MNNIIYRLIGLVALGAMTSFSVAGDEAAKNSNRAETATVVVVAPESPTLDEAIARLRRAQGSTAPELRRQRLAADGKLPATDGPIVLLLDPHGDRAGDVARKLGWEDWPRHDGYLLKSVARTAFGNAAGRQVIVIAAREERGLLYGCYALAEQIEREGHVPQSLDVRSEPRFAIRGWESLLENFWCQWLGGSPDWFRNDQYLAYLRDSFSRAPSYRINMLALMGRGDVGELHTLITYDRWDRLAVHRSAEARRSAKEQADVLEDLSRDAGRFGVRLFLWDHELQLPRDFVDAYPEARGQGAPVCLSSPLVWKLLEDKYEESFRAVPNLAGIILVLSETQTNVLLGSSCQCETCRAATGEELTHRIIETALAACRKHHKELIVRNFGHHWKEIDTIFAAVRGVQPADALTVMSKMVPWDFFGLQLPPDPLLEVFPDRPCVLEDSTSEFRGKTHVVVLPADYYARHLRRAAAVPAGRGAFLRLDHTTYPRSIFSMPNEFNVWLTGQLLWSPEQSLDGLWRQWAARRYGEAAADGVVAALRRSADIWEHSTNSFGFYCTSAHGDLAPFYHGDYCAYINLIDTAPLRTRTEPELEKTVQKLFYPDRKTLDAVVAERQQAVQWAKQSLAELEKAKPHLAEKDYAELSHYLRVMYEGSQLWREIGDLYFTGLAILRADKLPDDLVERLRAATERALRQARRIEQQFGRGTWPVAPDTGSPRKRVENILAGLWAEVLDKPLGLTPLPLPVLGSYPPRKERTNAEELYLALLQTTFDLQPRELALNGSPELGRLAIEGSSFVVNSTQRGRLSLPLAMTAEGDAWDGASPHRVRISVVKGTLQVQATRGTLTNL